MNIKGNKHSEETRQKMSQSQKARFANETPEKREKRINAIRQYYANVKQLMEKEYEERQRQAHIEFIVGEYNRLKANGTI